MRTSDYSERGYRLTKYLVVLESRTPFYVLSPEEFDTHEDFLYLLRDEVEDIHGILSTFPFEFERYTMSEGGLRSIEYRLGWTVRENDNTLYFNEVQRAISQLVSKTLGKWLIHLENPDLIGLWPFDIEPKEGHRPTGVTLRLIDPYFMECTENGRKVLMDKYRIRLLREGVHS